MAHAEATGPLSPTRYAFSFTGSFLAHECKTRYFIGMQEGALACKQVRVTLRSVTPEPCDGALSGAPDPESRVHSPPPAHGESDPACGEAAGVMPALAASSGMAGGACGRSASAAATVPDAASEPLAAATSWLESLKEGASMPEHSIALTLTRARALTP